MDIRKKIKRIFDICFSLIALLATSPIFLLIALLIFITTRSLKVIYSHERIGQRFQTVPLLQIPHNEKGCR